ncbi:beta-N-acetylhexosaminidase [Hoylesella shahii]|jgi:beta-L-N-acetylhexosaminidase|uniref:beta-N-acetylhexosaminidase n=1 Tax=Hoylesella shahii DSM 15611 = JCM 12083 TaxID=1122991 RepID=A0A318I352_9BACT|nr:beta-N-acetylhexosaminidase [Hoylesella shahii]PXX22007.1 hexosaminidase [Hoylesella shahii DSM 15611 = JCM 12083]
MKHLLLAAALSFSMLSAHAADANYNVVPLPKSVVMVKGQPFNLTSATTIVYEGTNPEMKRNARFLSEYIQQSTGIKTTLLDKRDKKAAAIVLVINPKVQGDEAYRLTVNNKQVTIAASTPAGVFYGIQTLRKSLPVQTNGADITLPAVDIADAPRFGYRGMMLDCGRHFFPVSFVKKFIDILAMHNMNVFHWHLTEDQGWRLEIKSHPELTAKSSMRSGTVIGHNATVDDSIPHGGFYTQQEARDIVEYARQRHITVIPEIDMPGHTLAALAAYPELGCTGGPYEVGHRWGVYKDVLCLGKESTYKFVQDVIDEVVDIFPAKYFHIGGDESPTVMWEKCPNCLQKAKDENTDIKHLQQYFTNRIEKYLNSKGKSIIGWDEILEGKINQSATIMSWRGVEPGLKAAKQGHDVIMTPSSHVYFDHYQAKETKHEPDAIGGCSPVEKVYSYEPLPETLDAEAKNRIKGVQANLWTEYIPFTTQAEYMVLPRMAALAEVQWTPAGQKNFDNFSKRALRLSDLYDRYGYVYARHLWKEKAIPTSALW